MNAPLPNDIARRVAQYIKLRDKIAEIKDRQKTELAPYVETLGQLNAVILKHLNDNGLQQISSDAGTAYRKSRASATLADADAFMRFVKETDAFELMDCKANAPAVEEYIEKHGSPPPGVNFTRIIDVGVRRK